MRDGCTIGSSGALKIQPLVFSSYNVWAPSWNMKLKEDWEENKMWSI